MVLLSFLSGVMWDSNLNSKAVTFGDGLFIRLGPSMHQRSRVLDNSCPLGRPCCIRLSLVDSHHGSPPRHGLAMENPAMNQRLNSGPLSGRGSVTSCNDGHLRQTCARGGITGPWPTKENTWNRTSRLFMYWVPFAGRAWGIVVSTCWCWDR